MFTYTIRRLLFAIPTLLVISFIIFALLDLAPNDPTGQLPLTIPPEVREKIRLQKAENRRRNAIILVVSALTTLLFFWFVNYLMSSV